jgi:hypothetical protein
MTAAGILVALATGNIAAAEVIAMVRKLRETAITHPQRFIRELAAACDFTIGADSGTGYRDYEETATRVIAVAAGLVAREAPAQLADFRGLLAELAAAVAGPDSENGLAGLGGQRQRASRAAVAAVIRAAGTEGAG